MMRCLRVALVALTSIACPQFIVCNNNADCLDGTECGSDNTCVRPSHPEGVGGSSLSTAERSSSFSSSSLATSASSTASRSTSAVSSAPSSLSSSSGGSGGVAQPPFTRILLDGDADTVQPDGEFIYFCGSNGEFQRVGLSTGDATTRISATCGVIDHQGHGYFRQQSNDGPLMEFPLVANAVALPVAGAAALPLGTPFASDGTNVFFRRRDTFSGNTEPSLHAWNPLATRQLVMGSRDYYSMSWANGHLSWVDLPAALFSVASDGSAPVHTQRELNGGGEVVGSVRAGAFFFWAWDAGTTNQQLGTINRMMDGDGANAAVTTLTTERGCGFQCVNGITADSAHVYWTSRANLAVRRVAVGATQVEDVFRPTACGPGPVMEYGGRLYWVEECQGPSTQYLMVINKP